MKKLMAVMLVIVMVLASAVTAFADVHEDNVIKVKPADEGTHTYTAYEIVVGDVTREGDAAPYTYIFANAEWGGDVTPDADNKVDGRTPDEFLKYWKDNSTSVTKEQLADLVKTFVSGSGKSASGTKASPAEIKDLKDGFYIIVDTTATMGDNMARTDYILISVTGGETKEVNAKSDVPTFEKKVQENVKYQNVTTNSAVTGLDRENGYNDVADYSIGDTVPFALYSKVPNMEAFKLYNIMFEDTMDPGLTYNENSVVVTIGSTTLVKDTDYTLEKVGNGFKLKINLKSYNATTQTSTAKYNTGDVVVVKYTGTLNENAVIGTGTGNKNVASFKFTNDPNKNEENEPEGTTPDDEVIVFTYGLDINKFDGTDNTKKLDAEFKLQATSGDHTGLWAQVDANGKICAWGDEDSATVLKTGDDGLFEVRGLDDGTYELKETKAPTGYNNLPETVKITIKAGVGATYEFGTQTWTGVANDAVAHVENETSGGIVTADVENNKGSTLPETGGIGTTILYTLGGILVVGAGVLLVARRKMER